MTRARRLAAVLGAVVVIAAGAYAALRHESPPLASQAASTLFYSQSLRDAAGVERAMRDYRGKVVVVNFWATWCVPCVKEIPTLSKVNAQVGGAAADARVAFVGLGVDSPDNIAAFATRFKPSYPLFAAGAVGTDLARAFGDEAGALPFTVVLDGDGRVAASHLGIVDEPMLKRWLDPLLAEHSKSRT